MFGCRGSPRAARSLNYLLLSAFFPTEWDARVTSNIGNIMLTNDLIKTTAQQSLNDFVYNGYWQNLDPMTAESLTDKSWFSYTVSKTRGGVASSYTGRTFWPGAVLSAELHSYVTSPVVYAFSRILLVTDHDCGSACAQFTSKMRYWGKALILTVGGRTDQVPDTASFCGGNVEDWDSFVDQLNGMATTPPNPIAAKVGTTAAFRFNHHEAYIGAETLPREFSPIRADYVMRSWPYGGVRPRDVAFYTSVVPYLNSADFTSKLAPLGTKWTQKSFADQVSPHVAEFAGCNDWIPDLILCALLGRNSDPYANSKTIVPCLSCSTANEMAVFVLCSQRPHRHLR